MTRHWVLALAFVLCACNKPAENEAAKAEPVKQYDLQGEILRLDPKDKIAAIKHEKIGDWMGAMTMEFPVREQKDFDAMHEGERIKATVYVQGDSYWVGGVQPEVAAQ